MKCLCGFDSEAEQEIEDWDTKKTFIEIDGKFTRYIRCGYNLAQADVEIVACPECHTLRLSE